MFILAIRTDKPEAELYLYDDEQQLTSLSWQAHRQLAETIHLKVQEIIDREERELNDVQGIAIYKGPGSFTGLRIGVSVANALAGALNVPIVGSTGEDWLLKSCQALLKGENDQLIRPEYGALPHITKPKH